MLAVRLEEGCVMSALSVGLLGFMFLAVFFDCVAILRCPEAKGIEWIDQGFPQVRQLIFYLRRIFIGVDSTQNQSVALQSAQGQCQHAL